MDRLKREGNPPVGQLASPVPQYKGAADWETLEGEGGASFVKDRDAIAKLEQVRALLSGVATEDKLEQARALLATIGGKDFATQATLAQVQSELTLVKSELQAVKTAMTDGTQKVQQSGSIAELQTDLLATIAYNTAFDSAKISSWANVQHIVRAGLADKVFRIGDQFLAEFDGVPVVWDVIGINHDTPSNNNFTHSLTIQSHDCLVNAQFDAPEPNNPDSDRKLSGNNRYLHSAIKQWLNSTDALFAWEPQHEYDAPPSGDPYAGGGFLHRLDPELAAVIGPVDKQAARNTVTDGGGQDTFSDKVFLLSRVEVYGGTEGVTVGEAPYPYYESLAASPTSGVLEGRIKYLGASARLWWLRSPFLGHAHSPRLVTTDGQVGNSSANYSIGVAPACTII